MRCAGPRRVEWASMIRSSCLHPAGQGGYTDKPNLEDAEGLDHLQLQLRHHAQSAQVDGGSVENLVCCGVVGTVWISVCLCRTLAAAFNHVYAVRSFLHTSRRAGSGSSFRARTTSPDAKTSSTARSCVLCALWVYLIHTPLLPVSKQTSCMCVTHRIAHDGEADPGPVRPRGQRPCHGLAVQHARVSERQGRIVLREPASRRRHWHGVVSR